MTHTTQILIADDHPVVRDGLKMLLNMQPDLNVIAEAEDGVTALQQAQATCPDVAILDIGMPRMNGLDCAAEMGVLCPQTRIIMLSIHGTSEYVIRAMHVGARGYLLKDSLSQEIIRAIHRVQAGQVIVSHKIAMTLNNLDLTLRDAAGAQSPLSRLTPQERRVLQGVVEGMTSAEIAEQLALSPKTVETYRSRIMSKLGVSNLAELVRFAIIHGITPLDL